MCLVPSVRGPVSTGKTLMAMACEKASKLLRTPETTDRRWEASKGMTVVTSLGCARLTISPWQSPGNWPAAAYMTPAFTSLGAYINQVLVPEYQVLGKGRN